MKKFCANCGNEIDASAKFCENCGAQQSYFPNEPAMEPVVEPVSQEIKPKKGGFKKWIPTVACLLVVAIVVGVFAILNPFDKDGDSNKKDSSDKKAHTANAKVNEEDITEVLKKTFEKNNLSFDMDLEVKGGGQQIEGSAEARVVYDQESGELLVFMDMDIEGNFDGEMADFGVKCLVTNDNVYAYTNGMATILPMEDIEFEDVPEFELTWESFYNLLEQSGGLEDFEEQMNREEFEKACEEALKLIGKEIKVKENGSTTTYTFKTNVGSLIKKAAEKFEDAFKRSQDYRDFYSELDEMPQIDTFIEATIKDEAFSNLKFELEAEGNEIDFELKLYDRGKTKITDKEVEEFIELCERTAEQNESGFDDFGGFVSENTTPGFSVTL